MPAFDKTFPASINAWSARQLLLPPDRHGEDGRGKAEAKARKGKEATQRSGVIAESGNHFNSAITFLQKMHGRHLSYTVPPCRRVDQTTILGGNFL